MPRCSHFAVTLGHPRWMSDAEEDKLRAVLETWIVETPQDYEMTRLELREHLNEITVGSQTGMRKGNQYALTWPDINFKLRLITLPDTKTGVPHTVPMTDDVYEALKDQQEIQARMQELRGGRETKRMKLEAGFSPSVKTASGLKRPSERRALPILAGISSVGIPPVHD